METQLSLLEFTATGLNVQYDLELLCNNLQCCESLSGKKCE